MSLHVCTHASFYFIHAPRTFVSIESVYYSPFLAEHAGPIQSTPGREPLTPIT